MRLLSYMAPGFPHDLFHVVGELVGAEVDFDEERSGPAPGHDPFRDGSADLGWICSTSYLQLALHDPDPSVRLVGVAWVPDDPDSHDGPVYHGDLVTASPTIRSLEDLRGRRIGCNDEVSLSGHRSLRIELRRRGEDPDRYADLVFTGGHHRSLDLVLSGELDAAVVDSVVRIGRSRHDAAVASLTVLDRLGPWPVQPLVASTRLSDDEVAAIRRRILDAADHPALREQLERSSLRRLVEVGGDHYAAIADAVAHAG